MQPSLVHFHCCFASVIVMVYGLNAHTDIHTHRERTSHILLFIIFNSQPHSPKWRIKSESKEANADWLACLLSPSSVASFSACHYFYCKKEHSELALWYVTRSCNDARRRRNVQRHWWQPHTIWKTRKVLSATVSWAHAHAHTPIHSIQLLVCSFQFNSYAPPNAFYNKAPMLLLLLLYFFRSFEINVRFIRFECIKL